MKIHYLQHVSFEGPGSILPWLERQQHTVTATRFYEPGHQLPAPDAIDALIIMGGPMGVYDEEQHPWLAAEKQFITTCIRAGKKVLGICLGAQLMAVCLGAKVYAAREREIGWFPVAPAEACRQTGWFYQLFKEQPVVFHWHGDAFDIPGEDPSDLLYSAANPQQAFCYNEQVIGLQFHLEVTEEALKDMIAHGAQELSTPTPSIQPPDTLLAGAAHIAACNRLMAALMDKWLNA